MKIVERLTFRAKYGRGDELAGLFREMPSIPAFAEAGIGAMRLYTDATGPMFTVAVEQEYEDLEAYGRAMAAEQQAFASPEFQEWFRRMVDVTELGERQLYQMEAV